MINYNEGQVILIDKPLNKTSFQAVKHVKYVTKVKKVGHAGTLDPLATGLMIICTGKFTKKLTEFTGFDKEYTGIFTLGATTPSYDLETLPQNFKSLEHINTEHILQLSKNFIGHIEQIPPIYSAIKVDGKRAYNMAREGKSIELKSRIIQIFDFEITKINLPEVSFRVHVSKGTYIRTLAHDFGQKLGCGAYLSALRRTKIGNFSVEHAQDFDTFKNNVTNQIEELKS